MKQSIIRRYPELTEKDISLRDDGKGIYIESWNSNLEQPTMEQVLLWVEEDKDLPKPLTELEELKIKQELMQQAIDDLIFSGGGF